MRTPFTSGGQTIAAGGRGRRVPVAIVSPALASAAAEYEAGAWQLDFMAPRAIEAKSGARYQSPQAH